MRYSGLLFDRATPSSVFAAMVFIGFFAHMPDLGGDTPTRLLFGWGIFFALIGFFGRQALRRDGLTVSIPAAMALLVPPAYFMLLGLFGHTVDPSFAWTPALMVLAIAALYISLDNAEMKAAQFEKILLFAVVTQALLVLGSKDYPLLAAIPGPLAWPSRQPFVFGGYWQVNVMTNILSCMTLWSLWHVSRQVQWGWRSLLIGLCAFILFPLVVGWSNSFSGFFFLIVGLAGLGLTLAIFKDGDRRRFAAFAALILVSLFAAAYGGLGVDETRSVIAKAGASSAPDRIGIWLRALYAFVDAPLFGHGLGHFGAVYNEAGLAHPDTQAYRWIDNTRHAHNIVLHNLVEIGLVGTVLLLGPFIWLGISLLRRAPQHWITVAILTPILGHMMTGYPQRQSAVPLMLIIVIICHMGRVYGGLAGRQISLTGIREPLRIIGLAGLVLPAMIAAIWTGIDYSRASGRHLMLSAPQYSPQMLPWRYGQPDITHPFLGHNAHVQATFGLTARAVYAQDKENLPKLLSMLAASERTSIRGAPTWGVLIRGYIIIGDFDKAREVMNIAAQLKPAYARNLMRDLSDELKVGRGDVLRRIAPNPYPAE